MKLPTTRYYGSKRKIVESIWSALEGMSIEYESVLDLFRRTKYIRLMICGVGMSRWLAKKRKIEKGIIIKCENKKILVACSHKPKLPEGCVPFIREQVEALHAKGCECES